VEKRTSEEILVVDKGIRKILEGSKFDGIVRELTDVRYVLELKSNLISLGVLDSCGCKYTCQGGTLTLSKGSLVLK
jgi:hypothetical protein